MKSDLPLAAGIAISLHLAAMAYVPGARQGGMDVGSSWTPPTHLRVALQLQAQESPESSEPSEPSEPLPLRDEAPQISTAEPSPESESAREEPSPRMPEGSSASAGEESEWLASPKPPYPSSARDLGHEGLVKINVRIDADGSVGDPRVAKSSGSRVLDERTMAFIVARWRHVPVVRSLRIIVPVKFELTE